MTAKKIFIYLLLCIPLSGCDTKWIEKLTPEGRAMPEALAIGSACRQAGKSIEQCFEEYSYVSKAGIHQGWREMNEYMKENNMQAQPSNLSKKMSEAGINNLSGQENQINTGASAEKLNEKKSLGTESMGAEGIKK